METVKLVTEEGQEIEFEVVADFEIDDVEYAILNEPGEEEVIICRVYEKSSGELELVGVEDDDEVNLVLSAYEELIDELEEE